MSIIARMGQWLHGRVSRTLRRRRGQDMGSFTVTKEAALDSGAGASEIGQVVFGKPRRIISKWSPYLDAYSSEFAPYRDGFVLPDGRRRPLRMLEIGIYQGGSLQLWKEYFGKETVIFGVDVDPRCAAIDEEGIEVRIGSQDDPEFLRAVVKEMGGVDIVLDDGSHLAKHQRASFETLFPLLSDGGVYVVEDLHTSYWPDFGGSYRGKNSFIQVTKQLVDDMHAWYHTKGQAHAADAAHSITHINIYDSIVFIHKSAKTRPYNFRFGTKVRSHDPGLKGASGSK